jgi:hypothetical protein
MAMATPVLIVDEEEDSGNLPEEEDDDDDDDEPEFETELMQELEYSTTIEQVGIANRTDDDLEDCLETWDDLGNVAIAVGSRLVNQEAAIIRKLCHRMEEQSKKRKVDELDSDTGRAERKNLITKTERMRRMAGLLYNLEQTHRRLRWEMEAIANGNDNEDNEEL